jgi:predicted molibdopterin-dependent oxidoreductase YjgC
MNYNVVPTACPYCGCGCGIDLHVSDGRIVHLLPSGSNPVSNGPDSIACLSSARCTNQENYLMQKFARAVIGTNNIEHCARPCHVAMDPVAKIPEFKACAVKIERTAAWLP